MVVHDRTRLIAGSCFLTFVNWGLPLFDIRQEKSNSRRVADPAVRKLRKMPEVSGCGYLYIRIDREIDPKSLIYSFN